MHSDITNDHTSNDCSPRNGNKRLKESHTRKTFNIFTTKDSYNGYVPHNTESTAVRNLTSESWGSPLVQEKCQGEKACDKGQLNNNNNNNNNKLRLKQSCYRPGVAQRFPGT
jgi:hypothetical protein